MSLLNPVSSPSTFRADFDRIALLEEESWSQNRYYHKFLSKHLPRNCDTALEIGCGTGAFSRLLAKYSQRVIALDLSPQMIRVAEQQSKQFPNIDFQVADVTASPLPAAGFDCIATIATLHHLPLAETLSRMKDALNPGGVLLVLDLYQAEGLSDALASAFAMPFNVALRLFHQGRLRPPRSVREAWAEHERHDSYATLTQVRQISNEIFPGATLRKHLLWRYSLTWQKEA